MNRSFIVTLLVIISLAQSYQPAKDFVIVFFKASIQRDIILPDECLGDNLTTSIADFQKYLTEENYLAAFLKFLKVKDNINDKCPIEELDNLSRIIKDKMENGIFFENLLHKIATGAEIIEKFKSEEFNGTNLGTVLGKVLNVFLENKDLLAKFNGKDNGYDFFKGLTSTMIPEEGESKCLNEIMLNIAAIEGLFKSFEVDSKVEGKHEEALANLFNDLKVLLLSIESCRFKELWEASQQPI